MHMWRVVGYILSTILQGYRLLTTSPHTFVCMKYGARRTTYVSVRSQDVVTNSKCTSSESISSDTRMAMVARFELRVCRVYVTISYDVVLTTSVQIFSCSKYGIAQAQPS